MRVGVIGGGIIGLAIAFECVQRGHDVTVYDPDPGRGASYVAAGMLAPVSEAYFGEEALTRLLLAAAQRWHTYDLGDVGYSSAGTLQVGLTADDMAELTRLRRHQASLGAVVQEIDVRVCEPLLHPRSKGVLVPDDHQVDPRRVVQALIKRVHIDRRTATVDDIDIDADAIVIATGSRVEGLPVRPVKGVLLRLGGPIELSHTIRGYAHSRSVYIVPRADGEVVVGATVEERTDLTPQAGAVRDLLRAATDLVPDLAECALNEVNVGHRPATPDNGPIVGRLRDNVFVAAGHYRHGVLAAPLTADVIADLIDGADAPDLWKPFAPGRFM